MAPPKQVYGKRTANLTASRYAKFMSPGKDDFTKDNLDVKEAFMKEVENNGVVSVVEVEQQLEALALKNNVAVEKATMPSKERGQKLRKALKSLDLNSETPKEEGLREEQEEQMRLDENLAGEKDKDRQPESGQKGATKESSLKRASTSSSREASPSNKNRSQTHEVIPSAPRTPVRKGRGHPRTKIPNPQAKPHLLTPDKPPEPSAVYTTYAKPLLDLSDRKKIISFEEWASELDPHFTVTKIAEASFSEVYRLKLKIAVEGAAQESVLKLVALRTPDDALISSNNKAGSRTRGKADTARRLERALAERKEKDLWKSVVEDVQSEVRLLQNLNHIPGFTNFRELTILQGRPSASFCQAWRDWNKARARTKKSEFPNPTKKSSYDDTQLWAVVEMQDAGTDCEKVIDAGGISNIWEIWDVFWGVCLSVAKAEEAVRFEHRDLHLENVCIRSTRSDSSLTETAVHRPLQRKLGFTGLETTVIDYTLARADVVHLSPLTDRRSSLSSVSQLSLSPSISSDSESPASEPDVAYLDLNKDMGLFTASADSEYQYEIYRYMRAVVLYNDPMAQNNEGMLEPPDPASREMGGVKYVKSPSDVWKGFYPKTNLLWAHFLLYKLLLNIEGSEPKNLADEQVMRNIKGAKDEEKVKRKATRLHKILQRVELLLDPYVLGREGCLESVKELVVLAMERGWLDAEDVMAC
ncbi:hypothetical protein CC78DRAFT_567873 [Lojkania enalia]|uniref:non-specific serine/threonine protein kinase n=1 Tax=Lojkania enalia TaxID=147567 RepID=A0A9P4N431_9PLEO|nr:hypothetical protein CC78DRAFT_567873 [Didymosphaeria enalia]